MPSLNAMHGLEPDKTDLTRQPLGHPTRPAPDVRDNASKPTSTPGILKKPDGMLETQLPTPVGVPGSPLAPFTLLTITEYDSGDAQDPIKFAEIGATYLLSDVKERLVMPRPGMRFLPFEGFLDLVAAHWARQPLQAKPARVPKVGDWVRILSGQRGHAPITLLVGQVGQITAVRSNFVGVFGCRFQLPGKCPNDGELMTEFASAPMPVLASDLLDDPA